MAVNFESKSESVWWTRRLSVGRNRECSRREEGVGSLGMF